MTPETPPQMAVTVEQLEQAKDALRLHVQRVYGLGLAGDAVEPAYIEQAIDAALHGFVPLHQQSAATGGVRTSALEEAARVADGYADMNAGSIDREILSSCVTATDIANAIRALSSNGGEAG